MAACFEPLLKRHAEIPRISSDLQPPERMKRSHADLSMRIALQTPQLVPGRICPQRTQSLGRRHPHLPVAIPQSAHEDGSCRAGPNPSEGPAADHALAPAALLHECD